MVPGAEPTTDLALAGVSSVGEAVDDPHAPQLRLLAPGEEAGTARVTVYGEHGAVPLRGAEEVALTPGVVTDVSLGGLPAGAYAVSVHADVPVVGGASVDRRGGPRPAPRGAAVRPRLGRGATAAARGGRGERRRERRVRRRRVACRSGGARPGHVLRADARRRPCGACRRGRADGLARAPRARPRRERRGGGHDDPDPPRGHDADARPGDGAGGGVRGRPRGGDGRRRRGGRRPAPRLVAHGERGHAERRRGRRRAEPRVGAPAGHGGARRARGRGPRVGHGRAVTLGDGQRSPV
ncbi:MAG: DUF5719 family protein [Cellulosimicrobium funkei]